MKTAMRTVEVPTGAEEMRGGPRKTRVVIRRVEPWSILKFSMLFYFCLMLVFLFALLLLYWALGVIGALDSAARLMTTLGFGSTRFGFHFHGFWIFSRLFLIGIAGVLVWSFVNLFVALLYNLISDVVGGVQVTLGEKR